MLFLAQCVCTISRNLKCFSPSKLVDVQKLYSHAAGGYNGDKDGYPIPAGTDVFVSVGLLLCHLVFEKIAQDAFSRNYYDKDIPIFEVQVGEYVDNLYSYMKYSLSAATIKNLK